MNIEDHPCYGRARTNRWTPRFVFRQYLLCSYMGAYGLRWAAYDEQDFIGSLSGLDSQWIGFNYFNREDEDTIQGLIQLHS